jgi:hypothetical protein
LRYHERAHDVIRATRFPDAHQRLLLPPTAGLRDWRTQMSPDEVRRFEVIAGALLDELGYPRASPPPSMRARLGAKQGEALLWARRARISAVAGARVLAGRGAGER